MAKPVVTQVTGPVTTERTFADRFVVRFPRAARIVIYMVRGSGAVWVDVFTSTHASGCFFFTRAYGA